MFELKRNFCSICLYLDLRTKVKNKSKVEMAKEYKFMIPKDKIQSMMFKCQTEVGRN